MTTGPHEWELERRAIVADERDRALDERERRLRERERELDRRERALARRAPSLERVPAGRRRTAAGPTVVAPPPGRLGATIAETARHLFVTGDPEASLSRVAHLAQEVVAGCAAASVTLTSGASTATVAASDPLAADLDAVQHALRSGPCLRVVAADGPAWVDTADRSRWADFAARARALGVVGFLSYGLVTHDDGVEARLGSLNLYSRTGEAFTDDAHDVALILAAHLTIVVAAHQERAMLEVRERRMRAALSSRDVIGQAKGILMARQELSADEAFDVLRRASQRTNTRLHEVATRLVDGGNVPSDW